MKNLLILCFLLIVIFSSCNSKSGNKGNEKAPDTTATADEAYFNPNWEMVWNDEFDNEGLPDSTKWGYAVGGNGWGNNEKQYYTNTDTANAKVENGVLKIIARKDSKEGKPFSSARLITTNKGDWKYGKIEVKAKLPRGRGLWPAIWMLPTERVYGRWPACGEIDIMEHVGYNPDSIHQTVHTKSFNHMIGTQVGKATKFDSIEVYSKYHTYGIIWDEQKIDFYIDGQKRHNFENTGTGFAEWPFDQEFHIILNLAVGGNWGGKKGIDKTIFPATFLIDYVRVFSAESN